MFAGLGLRWRSRPSVVASTFASTELLPAAPPGDHPTVAVIQMGFQWQDDAATYAEQCLALVTAASGAQLICFPEQAALSLLALGIGSTAATTLLEEAQHGGGTELQRPWARAFPAIQRVYRATFSRLARASGAYIVAGLLPVPTGSGMRLVEHLFGPDGRVVFRQPKVHIGRVGAALGQVRGVATEVVPLPWARLAILPDEDAMSAELGAAALGAEGSPGVGVVVVPATRFQQESATPVGPLKELAEAGAAYVLRACLVGGPDGRPPVFAGRSGIYGPAALTADGSGALGEALSQEAEEVIVAELDLAQLDALQQERIAAVQGKAASVGNADGSAAGASS